MFAGVFTTKYGDVQYRFQESTRRCIYLRTETAMADGTKKFTKLLKHTAKEGTQEWEVWVTKGQGDTGVIHTRYGLQDGKKQETSEVISVGKNLGKKNETTPYEQACAEAEGRWNMKKDRKGYGLTVEESAVVRGASPMLANKYPEHYKKVDWGTAFTQPKLDGFRLMAHFDADGKVILLSRENQPLLALSDIKEQLEGADFSAFDKLAEGVVGKPPFVLDGEAYGHGMSLNEISQACKKRCDKTKKIKYHVYDAMLSHANFETRNAFAREFVADSGSDLLVPVETIKVRNETELMYCQQRFIDEGFEGAMLRHGTVGYQAGKRSAHLLKVKTFLDAEFKVVDFKLGRGNYAGVPIFVCVTADGYPFDVTAPGTMPEKRAMGKVARSYIGKKLTVSYQYFTKTESPVPFLPVAKRFHD